MTSVLRRNALLDLEVRDLQVSSVSTPTILWWSQECTTTNVCTHARGMNGQDVHTNLDVVFHDDLTEKIHSHTNLPTLPNENATPRTPLTTQKNLSYNGLT